MIGPYVLFLAAFLVAVLLTGLLRHYALSANLLDIPNARSSHQLPTPRGGGVAFVLVFMLALPVLYGMGAVNSQFFLALLGAGALVAAIGFLDDHGHIKARWRLLAHFCAAIFGLYFLHGLPALPIFGQLLDLGWLGHALAAVYLVWVLNLYNFMDGIDGLASIEAICVCLGAGLIYWCSAEDVRYSHALWLLAAAVAGFLVWNFPPAKIFMGDAGSGFLGIVLGLFSIQAAWLNPHYFWSWLILLGVFVVDASWTLCHRFLRGEKVYEAHRSHAYQYASRVYGSHKPISLAVAMINLVWLLPWALAVGLAWVDGLLGMILAYLPLFWLAYKFKAGVVDQE